MKELPQIEIREIENEAEWTALQTSLSAHFTQSFWYGEVQKGTGRNVRRLAAFLDDDILATGQFINYPLLFGQSYWYSAYGPTAKTLSNETLSGIKKMAKHLDLSASFVRLDVSPSVSYEDETLSKIAHRSPLSTYHGAYFQQRYDWYVDLSQSDEALLKAMHEKTRYSVRYAEKKEVKVSFHEATEDCLDEFYSMMENTAKRNKFSLHEKKYYKNFLKLAPSAFFAVAKVQDETLAMNLVVLHGNVAHYVFGASSDLHKNISAPHLLHFESMRESRRRGASFYSFGAIEGKGEAHSLWQGLTSFKKKFGGFEISHSPFYDVVLKPFWYYIYILRKVLKNRK